jgi:predicted dehydrogenase
MLTVAFIGFGNSVIRYHLPYIRHRSHIKIKSVYRRKEDRDSEFERQREKIYPEIHFTDDLNELLLDKEIDCIVINTPDATHVHYAKTVLNAGKHVLVEKPFAPTEKEAKEVFDLAKEKGLICYVNHNRRYDADFLTLKKVLDSGKLGNIIEIESHYDYFKPYDSTRNGPREKGWFIYSLGVHNFDQIISHFGVPQRVHYDVRSFNDDGAEDYFDLQFCYGNMKVSIASSLYVMVDYPRFLVHGTKGSFTKQSQGHLSSVKSSEPIHASFRVEDESKWGTLSYINEHGVHITEKVPSEVTDYGRLYDDLHEIILHGQPKIVKDEQVLAVLSILEATKENLG